MSREGILFGDDRESILSYLKEHPDHIDMFHSDDYDYTPLMEAVSNGDADIVDLLIEKGANLDVQDKMGLTALHSAFVQGEGDMKYIIEKLVTSGANINLTDNDGQNVLHHAASNCIDVNIIYFLHNYGADPNHLSNDECTPLYNACAAFCPDELIADQNKSKFAPLEIVDALINITNNINQRCQETGDTAILYAVGSGRKETVELLLKYGADPYITNNDEMDCFDMAAMYTPEFLPLLEPYKKFSDTRIFTPHIETDENIDTIDKHIETPLIFLLQIMGVIEDSSELAMLAIWNNLSSEF